MVEIGSGKLFPKSRDESGKLFVFGCHNPPKFQNFGTLGYGWSSLHSGFRRERLRKALAAAAVLHAGCARVRRAALAVDHRAEHDLVQPAGLLRLCWVGQLREDDGVHVFAGTWPVRFPDDNQDVAVRQA